MIINFLKLKGFRNLKPLELTFDNNQLVSAFVGNNGHGKTNLLESIYLSALSKSFRTRANMDLVNFNEDFVRINCSVMCDELKRLEIIITRHPAQKVLKVNGVKKKSSEFIGNLKAVFFSPDDLSEMAFAPRLRRRYMDILLSQLNHEYLDILIKYQEVLRNRNALLKKIREGKASSDELDFWDNKIAELGLYISQQRLNLVIDLQVSLNSLYKSISKTNDILEIVYQSTCDNSVDINNLLITINENRDKDIASGSTKIGPHRDDLQFIINKHDMVYFASRGEWRSLVLALKFAEIKLIEEKCGNKPVLLLDDVFSELDEVRQKFLFDSIKNIQTFISTTHKEFLDGINCKIYRVKDGEIQNN